MILSGKTSKVIFFITGGRYKLTIDEHLWKSYFKGKKPFSSKIAQGFKTCSSGAENEWEGTFQWTRRVRCESLALPLVGTWCKSHIVFLPVLATITNAQIDLFHLFLCNGSSVISVQFSVLTEVLVENLELETSLNSSNVHKANICNETNVDIVGLYEQFSQLYCFFFLLLAIQGSSL